jgi:hypothetical protein
MKEGCIARKAEKSPLTVNERGFHCPKSGKKPSYGKRKRVALPEKRKKALVR